MNKSSFKSKSFDIQNDKDAEEELSKIVSKDDFIKVYIYTFDIFINNNPFYI